MFRVAALDHFGSLRLAHLLYGPAAIGPVLEAAEVVDAVIAHVLESLTAERCAPTGAHIADCEATSNLLIGQNRAWKRRRFPTVRDNGKAECLKSFFHCRLTSRELSPC